HGEGLDANDGSENVSASQLLSHIATDAANSAVARARDSATAETTMSVRPGPARRARRNGVRMREGCAIETPIRSWATSRRCRGAGALGLRVRPRRRLEHRTDDDGDRVGAHEAFA